MAKTAEEKKATQKEYYLKNRDQFLKYGKEYRTKNSRRTRLKHFYNMTVVEYDELYNAQGGKCAICGIHQSELKQSLCVDHNHITGEIRGLLCSNCNAGIGMLQDNSDIIEKALQYMKDSQN